VVSEFAVECALDEGLGELLEQPVLTEEVFRLLVILQQLVEQFGSNRWHNLLLSSEWLIIATYTDRRELPRAEALPRLKVRRSGMKSGKDGGK
jgi:hypothetical protein